MKDRVQGAVTAGVALVGAGVMAAAPVAQQAPEVLRSANADVALAAALTGTPAENLALSAQRTVTGVVGAPIGFATAAVALAQGRNAAAAAILNEIVDGPQWAADPALYALDDLLPAPIGGSPGNVQEQRGTSLITQFRADQLIAARDDINEAIADSLGVGTEADVDDEGPVYAVARLGAGFAASGVRAAQSAVTAPLGLVAVAQGLQQSFATGNNTALYTALEAYIDGPNYVADPIVLAVDDVLPAPIGSDTSIDPTNMGTSEVSKFRANTLLGARDQVRGAVKSVLGVNSSASARSLSTDTNAAGATKTGQPTGPNSRVLNSLKATPGGGASTAAASTGAKHRAEPTGGLSNLFKKPVKKADTPSDSPAE